MKSLRHFLLIPTLIALVSCNSSTTNQASEQISDQVSKTDKASIVAFNLTDKNWTKGINKFTPSFFLNNSPENAELLKVGKTLKFSDGSTRKIVKVFIKNQYLNINFSGSSLNGEVVGFPEIIEILD